MGFRTSNKFTHTQTDKIGVLITNLGTPDAPTAAALRPYLKEFLFDPRVIEVPRLIWWCAMNFVILRIRPPRSAKAYQSVWTEQGSPLAVHTKTQSEKIAEVLKNEWGDNIVVDWAMRYGSPSIASALQKFQDAGVRKLVVLPLYPQYSGTTTASTFDAIAEDFCQRRWIPEFRFINCYHDDPGYISALAQSIKTHWDKHGRADKLIMSFHGIPKRYLYNGDPYHCHCHKTARLIAEALSLNPDEYLTTFQSRVGREEWLKPYTDETLKALPAQNIKSVQVICPGFPADCLETLEEIEEENKEYFMEAGGERYQYISALNSNENHIQALSQLLNKHMQGWEAEQGDISKRLDRAEQHPYNQESNS